MQTHLEWETATVMGPAALRAAASVRNAAATNSGAQSAWALVGNVHVKCHDGSNEAEIGTLHSTNPLLGAQLQMYTIFKLERLGAPSAECVPD
jgi:hypothetical protein